MAAQDEMASWKPPKLLKAAQVAAALEISQKTVYAWIKAGRLSAVYTPTGGIRIPLAQVAAIMSPDEEENTDTP